MQTWSQENPRVKINWEVAFEEFSESKMCGNIKNSLIAIISQNQKASWKGEPWAKGNKYATDLTSNILQRQYEIP